MLPFQPSQPGPGTSNKLDSPVVWTSNSRTTYVPYPVVWNEFYVSSIEDLESYSFGQPHDPEFLAATSAGERWRIVKREGDETSSSSSDDNRSSLRVLTPRARAVSLDTLTSRLDNRSHPSQIQNNWGNDPDVEHRRPSEFEDAAVETRSQISIRSRYSHDTGYDASSSCRDSHCSWDSRYQPYLSSFSTSEEVSISSTRQSEYSENDLSENSPTNYRGQSSEEISISSTRRSSSVSSFRYDTPSFLQEAELPSNGIFSVDSDLQEPTILSSATATIVKPGRPTECIPSLSVSRTHSPMMPTANALVYDLLPTRFMVYGGTRYRKMRWEWVVMKEWKSKDTDPHEGAGKRSACPNEKTGLEKEMDEKQNRIKMGAELPYQTEKDSECHGMSVGAEEIWGNILLGRFNVLRENVVSRNGTRGKNGKRQGKEVIGMGLHVPSSARDREKSTNAVATKGISTWNCADTEARGVDLGGNVTEQGEKSEEGAPPQQRIIIRHLREDLPSYNDGLRHNPSKTVLNLDSSPDSAYAEQPISVTRNRDPLAYQPSSSQESFPLSCPLPPFLATHRAMGPVRRSPFDPCHPPILIHRHSKVTAFSIVRHYPRKRGDVVNSYTSASSSSATSSSQRPHAIMLAPREVQEETVIGRHEEVRAVSLRHNSSQRTHSEVDSPAEKEQNKSNSRKNEEGTERLSLLKRGKHRRSEHNPMPKSQTKSDGEVQLARMNNEDVGRPGMREMRGKTLNRSGHNATGTQSLDDSRYERQKEERSRRGIDDEGSEARVLSENYKHAPLQLPKSISDARTVISSTRSQIHDSSPSAASRSSNISKWLLFWGTSSSPVPNHPDHDSSKECASEERKRRIRELENSFEQVGLLPPFKEKKNSGRNISGKVSHKKVDVLSSVPAGAYLMLLPLWPAETDPSSQRSSPFKTPFVPLENRQYLLVFFKQLHVEVLKRTESSSKLRKHLPGFRAMARHVCYSELQGTGVHIPQQGISVNGPLEDAFEQMPRSVTPTLDSSTPDEGSARFRTLATWYSRDAGIEFNPETLITLDLCTVMKREQSNSMLVKFTPIGRAVMEIVWAGGLALTSIDN